MLTADALSPHVASSVRQPPSVSVSGDTTAERARSGGSNHPAGFISDARSTEDLTALDLTEKEYAEGFWYKDEVGAVLDRVDVGTFSLFRRPRAVAGMVAAACSHPSAGDARKRGVLLNGGGGGGHLAR